MATSWSPIFGIYSSVDKYVGKDSIPTGMQVGAFGPWAYAPEKTVDGMPGHKAPAIAGGLEVLDPSDPDSPPRVRTPGTGYEAYSGMLAPSTLEYLNADLAKYYGMSRETAYQEALSNTAYQRSVQDMKAAGLNPAVLFGSGRVSSADGVGSVRSAASGGSGGYRRGSSSGKSQMFDSSMYGALAALGGLAGIAATGRPDGFWIGSQTAQGIMQFMNASTKK